MMILGIQIDKKSIQLFMDKLSSESATNLPKIRWIMQLHRLEANFRMECKKWNGRPMPTYT